MKPIRCRFGLKVIGFMISMEKKVLDREWNSGKLYCKKKTYSEIRFSFQIESYIASNGITSMFSETKRVFQC